MFGGFVNPCSAFTMVLFRRTRLSLGAATSNMFAPPNSGRWINPPHLWTLQDCLFPFWVLLGPPMMWATVMYHMYFGPHFSHYQDKNYYPTSVYTKEFTHKYKRMERWRWY
jgi:hypothetical protein